MSQASAHAFFAHSKARLVPGQPAPKPTRWDAFLSEPAAVVCQVAPSTVEDALPDHLRDAFATVFRLQAEAA